MNQGLCALIRSKRPLSFCRRRLGVSLLMGLIVLWPVAAPGATTGEPSLHTLVTTQVRRLWERDVPFVLRSAGIIHQPPEYVARQTLFALDRHDLAGVMRFVDHSAPSAHQQVGEVLRHWPPGALRQPGVWGGIGPYRQEPWLKSIPEGSTRRIPVSLSRSGETHELILTLHFGKQRGWQIIGAHYLQLPSHHSP
ncbi:MAG: hypothetical protein J7455_18530 [Roseiflexus sp.]|jgi:hypothetical protein|nr:hypothetical protein [Roseiflexus sp.]MBO9391018.1 hypothetical protein [Roseiflexus sp.]